MARKTKSKYKDRNASATNSDNFGTIFDSMCKSNVYKALSLGARHFYTLCRVQARSQLGRACLYKHGKETGREYDPEKHFVFPARHQELYGVQRQNGNKYLKELEQAGFIRKEEENHHRHKVNVYCFSGEWQR